MKKSKKGLSQKKRQIKKRKKVLSRKERLLLKQRREAAQKGWETRKRKEREKIRKQKERQERLLQKRRSEAARKGWETRKRKEKEEKVKIHVPVTQTPTPTPLPPKPPEESIEEPFDVGEEAGLELATGQFVIQYLTGKLTTFAAREKVDIFIQASALADFSVAFEARFSGIDMIPDDVTNGWKSKMDYFLLALSVEIQSYGPGYKVSIVFSFDPSDIVKPIKYTGPRTIERTDAKKNPYDLYKGLVDIPSNFSTDIVNQFATAREIMIPGIVELTNNVPTKCRIMILWGKSVMGTKVPRERIKVFHK